MADKQVEIKSKNEIATGDISPDLIIKSAGRGLENVTNDDITIPRLAIIQAGSPQRKKKDEKYLEGAEEGNIFNTVTNQLYSDSITVIPCGYRKSYVEWVPREKGGGLVAVHDMKPDGTKTRGDMHILLVGDPGSGKSQLLQFISKTANKSFQSVLPSLCVAAVAFFELFHQKTSKKTI